MSPRRPDTARNEESLFLKAYDPEAFERPSVAVDVVLLTLREGALHTLVIRRPDHPDKGKWQLPGGFIRLDKTLEQDAERVLLDKTGLKKVHLEQLYTFGSPKRDPRTRVLSVAYLALVDAARFDEVQVPPGDSLVARVEIPWEGEVGGPVMLRGADGKVLPMAFDHGEIVGMAIKRLRGKLDYTPIGFQFLPKAFTLLQLQRVHETIRGHAVNKDSFRRRMLDSGQLEATGEQQEDVGHRPAALFLFKGPEAL